MRHDLYTNFKMPGNYRICDGYRLVEFINICWQLCVEFYEVTITVTNDVKCIVKALLRGCGILHAYTHGSAVNSFWE
jgi:hypothetical protein